MKPICAACNLFFRMTHQGEYFEEGMPGPGAAKRERVLADGLHCGICGEGEPCHGHPALELEERLFGVEAPRRMKPGPLEGWQSYKLWVGDLWECPGCGAQIIVGFGNGPISEHYMSDYQDTKTRLGVTRRIDDC